MQKFGRNYVLTIVPPLSVTLIGTTSVTIPDIPVVAALPFTVEFDIVRNTLSSANMCRVRIYNLAQNTRNRLRYNQSNYGAYMGIKLQAGYGTDLINLPTIFQGNVSQAWSVREGNNFITQLECYDGGFAFVNGTIDMQVGAGIPLAATLTQMVTSGLPNVSLGAIGTYTEASLRAYSMSGNTAALLAEKSGGGFFVDKEKAYVLGTNEFSLANPIYISSASGLLGTPILEQTKVTFDMIFEPSLEVGQAVTLDSSTGANFNGVYKIVGVKHRGMISGAVCGDAVTTGEFFYLKAPEPAGIFGP